MPAKIPQHVREEQLRALPGKRFVRWHGDYKNNSSKAVMICENDHEWSATVASLIDSGRGCPRCARARVTYTTEEREMQLNMLPGKRLVRWVDGGYCNGMSRVTMRCDNGHEWTTGVARLINSRTGCPLCATNAPIAPEIRISQLNCAEGSKFVRWEGGYRNSKSKAVMECDNGHEWIASITNIIDGKVGCAKCSGLYRYSAEERIAQLNSVSGLSFVRWSFEYENAHSKAVMRCDSGHEWAAEVNSLLSRSSGCPTCAQYGFDPLSTATLYALRSECGEYVKVGISKDVSRRVKQLSRDTPFAFSTIATVNGVGKEIRELEKMFHDNFESSDFTGFDGATEWLKFDPQILSLLRILGA